MEKIYTGVDALSRKYSKHTVPGIELPSDEGSQHLTERGSIARRKTQLLKGETRRRRVGIPHLGDVQ